jgi:molybdate transport system ATP-binding protein
MSGSRSGAAAGSGRTALHLGIRQRFASGFQLEASVDVDLPGGTLLVLFGPSGAGKTTILREIAGLERPDSGVVRFGTDVWCDTAASLWQPPQTRRIGLVFQEATLFPHLTVHDNIRYGVRPVSDTGPAPAAPRPTVAEIETMLGLEDLDTRYPRELSGGEAQRVALARALAPRPQLLLLDEPFAALDAPTRLRLRRDLRALLQATHTPAVLVTHDRNEALAMGDVIAVVLGGRVRQVGAVADVFSRPVDAGVAASLGVDAVLPARVVAAGGGLVEVAVGEVVLHVAERDAVTVGADVYACVRAEDVTLELQAPAHASARNHLAARVVSIAAEGPVDRVTLDCGFALDALITRRSRDEMRLAPGGRVTAAVKATSVHLVPRV